MIHFHILHIWTARSWCVFSILWVKLFLSFLLGGCKRWKTWNFSHIRILQIFSDYLYSLNLLFSTKPQKNSCLNVLQITIRVIVYMLNDVKHIFLCFLNKLPMIGWFRVMWRFQWFNSYSLDWDDVFNCNEDE